MKKVVSVLALLLAMVLSVGLVGCSLFSSWKGLQKDFEKAGYTLSETVEGAAEDYKEAAEKDDIALTAHMMTKGGLLDGDIVVILEFKKTNDIKKMIDENEDLKTLVNDVKEDADAKEFVKKLEEEGYVRGNCLVFSINPLNMKNVKAIVKG